MSRTDAHAPPNVRAVHDPVAKIVHNGCQYDPSGDGRPAGYRTVERVEKPDWRPRVLEVTNFFGMESAWFIYDYATQFYLREGKSKPEPFGPRSDLLPYGESEIYVPAKFLELVEAFQVVECDLQANRPNQGTCYYDSEQADDDSSNRGQGSYWGEEKHELWYTQERQEGREFCRQAAAEYNTYGNVLEDEPYVPGSPDGAWGGGWLR